MGPPMGPSLLESIFGRIDKTLISPVAMANLRNPSSYRSAQVSLATPRGGRTVIWEATPTLCSGSWTRKPRTVRRLFSADKCSLPLFTTAKRPNYNSPHTGAWGCIWSRLGLPDLIVGD
jgi:hypothetical protein